MKKIIKAGNKTFEIGKRTYIMGDLNVQLNAISHGEKINDISSIMYRVKQMVKDGVDIINIGKECTNYESAEVSENQELAAIIPLIKAVSSEVDVPVSINTCSGNVAEQAIKSGAVFINDMWGFKKDPYISKVAAKYQVPCCLMHNRENKSYENLMKDIYKDLKESVNIALSAGVKQENIILDPGIGVSKTHEQSLIVMHHLRYLTILGYPLLLGIYDRSLIEENLEVAIDEGTEDTVTTTVIGIMKGYDFVRVDNVRENKKACVITDAVMRM